MSSVSGAVTDAVTQSNVQVIGDAPAMAMGSIYQTAAHSTGLMFQNAVNAQNQQNILSQAATTQGLVQLYSFDTIAGSVATSKIMNSPVSSR